MRGNRFGPAAEGCGGAGRGQRPFKRRACGHRLGLRGGKSRNVGQLFPAMPYTSYRYMTDEDVKALYDYLMKEVEPVSNKVPETDLGFPFVRPAMIFWNGLFAGSGKAPEIDNASDQVKRGQYLVDVLGHCGECHTPRNALGGMETARWLAGGPNPSGQGSIPNITPAKLQWSEAEIVEYLTTGFTPEFDSVGGHMAHVVENMARLPQAEREAVAAYLKQVPAVE